MHHGVLPGGEKSFFPEWVLPHSHQNPLWFPQLLEDISMAQLFAAVIVKVLLCAPWDPMLSPHPHTRQWRTRQNGIRPLPRDRLKWRPSKWIMPTQPWELISEKWWCVLCDFHVSTPGRAGRETAGTQETFAFAHFPAHSAVNKRTLLAHGSINWRKIKQWRGKS